MSIILDGDTGVSTLQNHEQITVDSSGNVNLDGDLRLHGGYTGLSSTLSGAMTVLGHNAEASQTNTNQIVSVNNGYNSNFIRMYYNQGISFHVNNTTNNAGDIVYDFANPGNQVASSLQAMNIDTSGRVTMPYQPAFQAYSSGGYQSVTDIPFTGTWLNRGNHFNTSTYTFTAPVAGLYQFSASVYFDNNYSTGGGFRFVHNGSQHEYAYHQNNQDGDRSKSMTIHREMQAGDTMRVILLNAGNCTFYGGTYETIFNGHLIG